MRRSRQGPFRRNQERLRQTCPPACWFQLRCWRPRLRPSRSTRRPASTLPCRTRRPIGIVAGLMPAGADPSTDREPACATCSGGLASRVGPRRRRRRRCGLGATSTGRPAGVIPGRCARWVTGRMLSAAGHDSPRHARDQTQGAAGISRGASAGDSSTAATPGGQCDRFSNLQIPGHLYDCFQEAGSLPFPELATAGAGTGADSGGLFLPTEN